jgi:hypothetical protein
VLLSSYPLLTSPYPLINLSHIVGPLFFILLFTYTNNISFGINWPIIYIIRKKEREIRVGVLRGAALVYKEERGLGNSGIFR